MRTAITLIFLLIAYVAFQFGSMYYKEHKETQRLSQSLVASNETLRFYKAQNGLMVAKSNTMQLKYDELKNAFPEILNEIRNLKINPKTVNSYTETVIKQEKQIITKLRDSIVRDTIKARVFNYQDAFYSVNGFAIGDSQTVNIRSTDSLIQVVYKGERYHPWLWILSRRKLQQSICSKNPNSKIIFNKTIEISK